MGNQWFRCKQFLIRQDQCAMKVGTDGVILGAWTEVVGAGRALDIGTGTGLLALMLAQRSQKLIIDAIEIDLAAARQAAENVAGSVFSEKISVQASDFRDFDPEAGVQYDLVICNPPYFNRAFKAAGTGRTLARHTDALDLAGIFSRADQLVREKGRISIIVPSDQAPGALEIAGVQGFYPERILKVHPVPGAAPKRHCLEFTRSNATPRVNSLVIEAHGRHGYSDAYRELTKDFYLDM
ncbi:MAG: methyltransferase [Bacteroidales bacterium]|nr:methyltransferase [Bacteroidales bacterium]MDT8430622.1 methyltransferase [Bacteroidales bacterium]